MFCYRKAALEAALRKKIEFEKKALSIVEQLLEEDITEEFLLNCVGVVGFYTVLYLSVVLLFKSFWNNLLQFKIDKPLIPSCASCDNDFLIFKGSAVKTCPSFAGLCTLVNPHSFITAFVYTSVVLY